MPSPYLCMDIRSLEDLAHEIDVKIATLKGERAMLAAHNDERFGMRLEDLGDEIDRLEATAEAVEEELEYQRRREDGSNRPIVL